MRKILLVVTFALVAVAAAVAQQFPVQVTPQLLPPYTVKISDYYNSAGSPKLNLLLLLRDFNRGSIQVRLRMSIESQQVRITTRPEAQFNAVTIFSGVPYAMAPNELEQYFNPNNLLITGISPTQYLDKLPEGFYTFCFEAVDAVTGLTLSNKGCGFSWLNLNEPPMLNIPRKAESVTPADNILFNWTPRHLSNPTASDIGYTLTLVELLASSNNPEADFNVGVPITTLEINTGATTTTYQPAGTMTPGRRYAWRVRARPNTGISNASGFKNDGNSEIFWFTYQNACEIPTGIASTPSVTSAQITWLAKNEYLDYKVIYREKANDKAEWFALISNSPAVVFTDLKAGTVYEYRVGAACEQGNYSFAATQEFTTKPNNVSTIPTADCGIEPTILLPGTALLEDLLVDQEFTAYDFSVVVKKVTKISSGIFSGEGYVKVPLLSFIKLAVTFNSITISADRKLKLGTVQTVYDPTGANIFSSGDFKDIVDVFTAGYGVGKTVTGEIIIDKTVDFVITNPTNISATPPAGYNEATGTVAGGAPITVTITRADGAPYTFTTDHLPVTIADSQGNIYQLGKDGHTVTSLGNNKGADLFKSMNPKLIDNDKALVNFVHADGETFALDVWNSTYEKSPAFNKEYEIIEQVVEGEYHVNAKAIAPQAIDKIKAVVTLPTGSTVIPADIKFVNSKGMIYTNTTYDAASKSFTIQIVGGPAKDGQDVYAVYKPATGKTLNLGKILVVSYEVQKMKLVLVPVNGAQVNKGAIEDAVKSVYNKVCVDWDVRVDEDFKNDSWDTYPKDGKLQVDGSGFWSVLSPEMTALNTAYRTIRSVEENTIYLFVLQQGAIKVLDTDVFGDMPRAKQFGYIFSGPPNQALDQEKINNTVLHELGHGVFRLKHLFDYTGDQRGAISPANVMDYPNGASFMKAQWDFINDPPIVLGVFENDEGAMAYGVKGGIPAEWLSQDADKKVSVSFLSPAMQIVKLHSTVKQAYFTFGITDIKNFPDIPSGVLKSFFNLEGKTAVKYYATFDGENFKGYFNDAGQEFTYLPKNDKSVNGFAIVLLPVSNGFQAYRLLDLSTEVHPYLIKAQSRKVISVENASSGKINASLWEYKGFYGFTDAGGQFGVSATKINPAYTDIISEMDPEKKNEQYLLFAKILEFRTVYPELFDRMTKFFNNWSETSVRTGVIANEVLNGFSVSSPAYYLKQEKAKLTAGYFDYICYEKRWFTEDGTDVLGHFLDEFKKLIKAQQDQFESTITTIMGDGRSGCAADLGGLNSEQIKDVIPAMDLADLAKICSANRVNFIGKLLEAQIVSNPYEAAIYRLMYTCPEGIETAKFLLALQDYKKGNGEHILGTLVSAVDDQTLLVGDDYNTKMMNYIVSAYKYLMVSDLQFTRDRIVPITRITLQNMNSLDPTKVDDLARRVVSYNYVGFTKKLFKQILCLLNGTACVAVFDQESEADYVTLTGQVSFTNNFATGFVTIAEGRNIYYNALDPIILDDKANLLNVYNEGLSGHYVPAILLYYLKKKGSAKTVCEAIQSTFDVVSLAIPGGQATLALRLLNYADKLSSISSLIGTASEADYPNFAKIMNVTSGVLGLANLLGSSVSSFKQSTTLHSSLAMVSKSIDVVSAANHTKAVEDLCTKINNVVELGIPGATDIEQILASTKKEKEMLVKILELEKSSAQAAGKADVVANIEKAIDKVHTISTGARIFRSSKIAKMFDKLASRFTFMKRSGIENEGKIFADAAGTQLAHIDAVSGEMIIDKFDEIGNLGDNAKLEESLLKEPFLETTTNGIVRREPDDLLFLSDGGKIRCLKNGYCFTANTPVQTLRGLKTIDNINRTDTVLSFNEQTKKQSWQKVTNLFTRTVNKLQRLIVGQDTIYTTPGHKFFTAKGWLTAAALSAGTIINTAKGSATVTDNVVRDSSVTVYNFTVKNTHTYYVGKEQLLVHNDCGKLIDILGSLGKDKAAQFIKDFKDVSNKKLLDKFINGQLDIKAWETFFDNGNTLLRKNEAALEHLSGCLKIKPTLPWGSIISNLSSIEEHLLIIKKILSKGIAGSDAVLSDLRIGGNKAIGADFVLNVLRKKGDEFIGKVTKLESYDNDIVSGIRRYDIELIINDQRLVIECKRWLSWNVTAFTEQFLKDLSRMNTAGGTQWKFSSAIGNIEALKLNVLNSLGNLQSDGTWLAKSVLADKFSNIEFSSHIAQAFGSNINTADQLVNELAKSSVFESIFEIIN